MKTEEGKKEGGDVMGGEDNSPPSGSTSRPPRSNGSLWAQMWLQLTNQRGRRLLPPTPHQPLTHRRSPPAQGLGTKQLQR